MRWPILSQPTSLDRESLEDVLTPSAIGNFLRANVLDDMILPMVQMDKRFRVSHAYKRFQPGNVERLTRRAELDEAQSAVVAYGAKLVMRALEEVAVDQYDDMMAELRREGMLGT